MRTVVVGFFGIGPGLVVCGGGSEREDLVSDFSGEKGEERGGGLGGCGAGGEGEHGGG